MVVIDVPRDYGYVLLVGTSSVLVAMWHGIRVGQARKKFGIKVNFCFTIIFFLIIVIFLKITFYSILFSLISVIEYILKL